MVVALAVGAIVAAVIAVGASGYTPAARIVAGGVAVAIVRAAPGFVVVKPNQSRVLILSARSWKP